MSFLNETTESRSNPLYFTVWRWHFYAGLYVIPFLLMLALTGLVMLWIAFFQGVGAERMPVVPAAERLSVSTLQSAAESYVAGGHVTQYVAPLAEDRVAVFQVTAGDTVTGVAIDPYTGKVLHSFPWRAGWYDLASNIHGTLMIGMAGDRLIEAAASLSILLIASGLYLHWPRNGGTVRQMLVPSFAKQGRAFWRSLHGVTAFWLSAVLFLFLISGLSWAGIWGGKMMQAWNTFPSEKWEAPLSDVTHASLNYEAAKDVPWALEQTPMPMSGSLAGQAAIMGPVTIDTVSAFGDRLAFNGRYTLTVPSGEAGVWTISHDSMSNDGPDPSGDRTLHIDRYTGNVLADIRYADYSPYAKAMAWGIAFHEGDLGLWNFVLNTLFIMALVFICVSGVVLWWKRRPAGAARLSAPPAPAAVSHWKGALLTTLIIALAFPMAGVTLILVMLVDLLLIGRIGCLKRFFS